MVSGLVLDAVRQARNRRKAAANRAPSRRFAPPELSLLRGIPAILGVPRQPIPRSGQAFFARSSARRGAVDDRVRHVVDREQVIAKFPFPLRAETVKILNRPQQLARIEARL